MKPGNYILIGFIMAVLTALGFFIGYRSAGNRPVLPIEPKVDTLILRDTIKVTEPVLVVKRVVDTIPYPVKDTIMQHDTIIAYLVREQVMWEDSLSRVYASGVNPQVDSVIHYTNNMVIIQEIPVIQVKKTRWGIGIQAGATIGKDGVAPYIGVGGSYNILTW
jgi:hypothetical protein